MFGGVRSRKASPRDPRSDWYPQENRQVYDIWSQCLHRYDDADLKAKPFSASARGFIVINYDSYGFSTKRPGQMIISFQDESFPERISPERELPGRMEIAGLPRPIFS